jgi:hypothetical protein
MEAAEAARHQRAARDHDPGGVIVEKIVRLARGEGQLRK